jgi:hypothetical protein
VCSSDLLGEGDATIAAPVVAHDDLVAAGRLCSRKVGVKLGDVAADRRERLAQPSFLVEDRDDDAQHVGLREGGKGMSGRGRIGTRVTQQAEPAYRTRDDIVPRGVAA